MMQKLLGLAVLSCLWVVSFLFIPEVGESQTCPNFIIEGFGKDTTGGCGGKVIDVTNLNNSGSGSLRACLEASGTRVCRPTVSGWVTLTDDIEILNGNLTLDGSAAPNGGLGVRGESVGIRASNVIFRHVRFRVGACSSDDSCEYDALSINGPPGGIQNIVLDHITTGWADDGTLDIVGSVRNVTVQWSLIHDSLGENGCTIIGSPSNTSQITMHHNLFYQCKIRNPFQQAGQLDYRNNVIYRNDNRQRNSFRDLISVISAVSGTPAQTNLVNNYFKVGSVEGIDSRLDPITIADEAYVTGQGAGAYMSGNKTDTKNGITNTTYENQGPNAPAVVSSPFSYPSVTTTSATQAYTDVLANAGATAPCRDSVDLGVITNIQNRSGPMLPRQIMASSSWPNLSVSCGNSEQLAAPSNLQVFTPQ